MQCLLQGKLNSAEFDPSNLENIVIFISLRNMTQGKATQLMFLTIYNITYVDSKPFISLYAWTFLSSHPRRTSRSCNPS